MGVSGSGKSTIGRMLAERLKYPFFDGDDYHPESNIKKMHAGIPLTDQDRSGWLRILNKIASDNIKDGAVIVCSALKESYRNILTSAIEEQSVFVFLDGSFELIMKRLSSRSGHFMPPELLKSQFEALEAPDDAVKVSIDQSPEEAVAEIAGALSPGH